MKPQRKCKKSTARQTLGITENTILVESSLKCRLLTAVLYTNVHSYRCLAHSVFDKCYEIPKKITKNTPKKPEGPQNGPDTENAVEPQQKCQSRAHFAHVFELQTFFHKRHRKNVSHANTSANYCVLNVIM